MEEINIADIRKLVSEGLIIWTHIIRAWTSGNRIIKRERRKYDMTCFRCKGDMENKLKTHAVTLEKCVIIIKSVPAMICTQCGEVYFTDDVMRKLEEITDSLENIIKEVAIVDYTDAVA